MTESDQHMMLVKLVKLKMQEIIPASYHACIFVDDIGGALPPQITDNYRPDLYYQFGELLVIGEAKTANDIAKPHSINQYCAYMQHCLSFSGTTKLILGVPWTERSATHNLLRRLAQKMQFDFRNTIIVDEMWRAMK